jgi:hypothetical protein
VVDTNDTNQSPPGQKPLPIPLGLPPVPAVVGVATRERPKARKESRPVPWGTLGVVALVLGALGAAGLVLLLPWYVRTECVEQAASHGITLTIGDVAVSPSSFRLTNVVMVARDLPDARLTSNEVDVDTSWLQPTKVSAKGMEVSLKGHFSEVSAAIEKWSASDHGFRGSSWAALAPLVTDGSRIVWQDPVGEGVRAEASGVHADVSWHNGSAVLHANSENVVAVLAAGTLGPWRVDIDRTPDASRTCVGLDPAIAGACTLLVVGDAEATTAVDVVLPRTPIGRLGVPATMLGLSGKDLQVEATAHYATSGNVRLDASTKGAVHGIQVSAVPLPLDVTWEGAASGRPDSVIDVKNARIAVGPLVGGVKGTFKRFTDGFRVDLAWSAGPVPCAAFDTPLAPGQPFDVAYQLRKLAESAGLTKLAGQVRATAAITLDSRDLGANSVRFVPEASCSLFGP